MQPSSLISALLLVSVASHAFAQDSGVGPLPATALSFSANAGAPQRDDLDGPRRGRLVHHHGYYAAPSFGVTTLDDQVAPVVGMRAAWLANRTLGLGFAFNAIANQLDEDLSHKGRALAGYGGLLVQYVVGSTHRVHGFVDTTLGGGLMCVQTGNTEGDEDECHGRGFFALEPTANLEINLTSFMRLSLGAGYRLALAGDAAELSNANLSGFVGKTALQFGRF